MLRNAEQALRVDKPRSVLSLTTAVSMPAPQGQRLEKMDQQRRLPYDCCMKDYKELKLIGAPESLSRLLSDISSESQDGWQRNQVLEERLPANGLNSGFCCFTCDERQVRRSADLWLAPKHNADYYYVGLAEGHLEKLMFCRRPSAKKKPHWRRQGRKKK